MMQCGQSNVVSNKAFSNENGTDIIGKWIYAAGVVNYSGDELSLFINGDKQAITDSVDDYQFPAGTSVAAMGFDGTGDESTDNWNYLDGSLDEIRVSRTARSPEWIMTSFHSMYSPNTFTNFGNAFSLVVFTDGVGEVVKTPDQIAYTNGTVVSLEAIGEPGWSFSHWSGDLSGSTNPDTITMDSDKIVTAHFTEIYYSLDVDVVGSGGVVLDPGGGSYTYGLVVELNATGDEGWHFDHWEADLSGNTNPENITIDDDFSVTAVFSLIPDSIPPVISNVVATPQSTFQGGCVNISCEVSDNVAVDEVLVNVTYPDGTSENLSMDGAGYYKNQTYSMAGTYYYFIWANDTSDNANVSMMYHFEVVMSHVEVDFQLDAGWNLITIPVVNNYTAKTLSANITGCELISWFDSVNQTYRSYIVGGPPGFNFQIKDGYGYFVVVNESSIFSMSGVSISSVYIPLYVGWNLIGWHHEYITTAGSLAGNISGCELISWFDGVNQTYRSYIVGGPPGFDFTITAGMGIFVVVNVESVWHGEG